MKLPVRWRRPGLCWGIRRYSKTAGNIGEWLFFRSMMSLGDRANPEHPAYGLMGWNETPQYVGPGSMDGYAVYYGDDECAVHAGHDARRGGAEDGPIR